MNSVAIGAATVLLVALAASPAPARAQASTYNGPRTPDGKPDLNGIWQVLGTAHWDLEPHSAQEGVPAGLGVVEGGEIPYQPWALEQRKNNYDNRMTADPVRRCFLPGVPRVTYMPFPFEITQGPNHVLIAYEFANASRTIFLDDTPRLGEDLEFWMGDSRGHWEGDTLVVESRSFNAETWFDQAGNFHSEALRVIERYRPMSPNHVQYQVTIEDPKVFTRPWNMNMIIYRRLEQNLQLLDYGCVEHVYLKLLAETAAKP